MLHLGDERVKLLELFLLEIDKSQERLGLLPVVIAGRGKMLVVPARNAWQLAVSGTHVPKDLLWANVLAGALYGEVVHKSKGLFAEIWS